MRYYGGKGKLLTFIERAISDLEMPDKPVAIDLFSGTSVVGRFLKQSGYRVIANDYLYFCKCLATARVVLNSEPTFTNLGFDPIKMLNQLPGEHGFFSETTRLSAFVSGSTSRELTLSRLTQSVNRLNHGECPRKSTHLRSSIYLRRSWRQ